MADERYLNEDALDPPPATSWGKLIALVPEGARVLDVGCGHGAFAAALRRLRRSRVTGIELDPSCAPDARTRCDEFIEGEIGAVLASGQLRGEFDAIVASDVLEHLIDPVNILEKLRGLLVPGGALIASIPNVTHLSVVAEVAAGRFPRMREGLLDATHIQFFGQAEVLELFRKAGYAARLADRVTVDPRLSEFHTDVAALPDAVLDFLDKNPHATTYQFIVRAVPEAWAIPADHGTVDAASPGATGMRARLTADLEETSRALARYEALASQKDVELRDLNDRLRTYHQLATEKDRQLQSNAEELRRYHEALTARDRESLALQARASALDAEVVRLDAETLAHTERRSPARERLAVGDVSGLRVLYVADRDDAPYRYRCVHGCEQLRQAGAVANVAHLDSADLLDEVPSYTLIVLFRLPWSERVSAVVQAARASGARVALEVDDLLFDADVEGLMPFLPRLGPAVVESYRRTFAGMSHTFDDCDLCLTTTEAIARRVRRRGKPAVVHPNLLSAAYVELSRFVYPLRRGLMRRPLIGYLSGSNTHDGDLASIAEPLAEALHSQPGLTLLLVGHVDPPGSLRALSERIAHLPYLDHRLYPWIMARCRAVLAPIELVNDFTNGKSALKVFEAGLFGVPAIAAPTAPYRAAIMDGVTGFVAATPADWSRAVACLADAGPSLRMGRAARTLALAEHAPAAWQGVLAQALLPHHGRSDRPTPRLRPTGSEPPRSAVARARGQARLARQAMRLAVGTPASGSLAHEAERAASLATSIAALPRQGRHLLRNGSPVGLVLVDRERTCEELDPGQGTLVFTTGRGAGNTVSSVYGDPKLLLPAAEVPAGGTTLVVQARARSEQPAPHLQLFWSSAAPPRFTEAESVRVRLEADDRWHAAAVSLPEGVACGQRLFLRLDPLDAPGEVELGLVALAPPDLTGEGGAALRRGVASRFLSGRGLEIGALHNPLPLPSSVEVRYVDRISLSEARAHYPELGGQHLVEPTVLCDADRLQPVATASEDFVVCNHVLEHMRDPLGALEEWLRVLRPGGHLYVSIPDHDNPLDRLRKITSFEHLLGDRGGRRPDEDRAHFADWTASVHSHLSPEQRTQMSSDLEAQGYSIHHHVFDRLLFERVLVHACVDAGAQVVELQENRLEDLTEYVAVLRKRGEPVRGRPVDVVVPVYNARACTRVCIESVLRHGTGDFRLVLVNDASTEPGLREDLEAVARADARVLLLHNEANAGFVSTANRGMRAADGRDVLLLNSDTEVFEGFLDRLRAAADADPATGILTPFSNNATICSIPDFPRDNPIPEGYTPERFARLVTACSRRLRPALPTGVGFCLWIKAEVLARVGVFDEEAFGRGYGEENDLCLRARKAGFTVRLCDDVFVYHKGKASFGEEGLALESVAGRNAVRLEARHPGYHAEIARFVAANPLASLHDAIRANLARSRPGAERALLFLLHMSPWREKPGGTEYHVLDLARALRLPRAVVAWPEGPSVRAAEILDGDIGAPVFHAFPAAAEGEAPRALGVECALRRAVELLGVTGVHVHHLMFWPLGVTRAFDDAGVPYVWTHHDYYAVCPNWNLYDFERREPCACRNREQSCLQGYARLTGALRGLDVDAERRRHRLAMDSALAGARAHVFPSSAALGVFAAQLGPGDQPRVVIEHGYDVQPSAERAHDGARLQVAIVGEVAYPIKGAERYLELLGRLKDDARIAWHVLGDVQPFGFQERLRAVGLGGRLTVHGRYPRHALPDLLRAHGIDVCVLLPDWHETFSYVLSEALVAAVPTIVSRRGALAPRMERAGAGCVVDTVEEAARCLAELADDRSRLAAWTERARAFVHRPVAASAAEHRVLYTSLGWLADRPLEAWEAPRLLALLGPGTGRQESAGGASPARARPLLDRVEGPLRRALHATPLAAPLRRAVRAARSLPGFGRSALPSPRESWHDLALAAWSPSGVALEALSDDPRMTLELGPIDPTQVTGLRFEARHGLPAGSFAQLYWSHSEAEGYSEENSAKVSLGEGDEGWRTYHLALDGPIVGPRWRAGPAVVHLRFDPCNRPGRIALRAIVVERVSEEHRRATR